MRRDRDEEGAEGEPGLEEQGGIVFSDMVFNVFAIVLIFLLLFPLAMTVSEAEAPTRNREEPAFATLRDCYVEALRPVSLFVTYGERGLEIVDYDAAARIWLARPRAVLGLPDGDIKIAVTDGADANTFVLDYTPRRFARAPRDAAGVDARADAAMAFLQREVYDRGYVSYFEIRPRMIGEFSAVFERLLASGQRFRWRLLDAPTMTRLRFAGAFDSADFCR